MNWILFAIIGHLSNGITIIVDKILLGSAFRRSATYAGLIGIGSAAVILLAPFVSVWPFGTQLLLSLISGITFILALWAFFSALSTSEPSRIVPIVGSLIPLITLCGSFIFLGERLPERALFGFFLLILATILLSRGGSGHPSSNAVWLAITSAFLFAIASVTIKAVYDVVGFLGPFIVSRIGALLAAVVIVAVIDPGAFVEIRSLVQSKHRSSKHKQPGKIAALLAIVGQACGAVGFVLVQIGAAHGSVSIVNALQAVQYALLVLVAFALRSKSRALLGEQLTWSSLAVKLTALAITAGGLYLIA